MADVHILVGAPVVSYRETVTRPQAHHVQVSSQAQPSLHEDLLQAMEDGCISPRDEGTSRAKLLLEEFGWDVGASAPPLLVPTSSAIAAREFTTRVRSGRRSKWCRKEAFCRRSPCAASGYICATTSCTRTTSTAAPVRSFLQHVTPSTACS
jgi:translation elongation factor EF-G